MAGLTNVQNEFLKLRLQNNPEFQADYFPNVITQGPVGPLHDVNVLKGNPTSNVFFERSDYKPPLSYEEMVKAPEDTLEDPEYMEHLRTLGDPIKGSEFRDVPVPYDYPGSRINIRTSQHGKPFEQPGMIVTGEGVEYHQASKTAKPINVTGGQTSAVYMDPRMVADYGTAAKAPRNEMVPTPDWYSELYQTNEPHVNQADINETIEGILSHEVGHGTTLGLEPFKSETEPFRNVSGTDVYKRGIDSPYLMSQEASDIIENLANTHTEPYLYNQNELYNRILDLERLKMTNPKNYKTHPMWDTYQNRALEMFNDSISMNQTYKNVPKRFRPKFETYYNYVKPSIQKYLGDIQSEEKSLSFDTPKDTPPRHPPSTWTPAGQTGPDTPSAPDRGRSRSRGETGRIAGGHHFSRGGLMDIPLPGRSRDI